MSRWNPHVIPTPAGSERKQAGQRGVSRRALLGGALAVPALLAVDGTHPASAVTAPAPSGMGLTARSLVEHRLLPSVADVRHDIHQMVGLGPRYTATSAHRQWIDTIEQSWRRDGLQVTRDHYSFDQWLAQDWSLDILDGDHRGHIRVPAYYTYSGRTGREGVTGDLVYLGPAAIPALPGNPLDILTTTDALKQWRTRAEAGLRASIAAVPGGVAGRIVLFEDPVAPLSVGDLDPILTYRYDPGHVHDDTEDYKRVWTTILTVMQLSVFKQAGAAGAVFILDASHPNTVGQYTPFIDGYQDLPALIVDRDTGARLRKAAEGTPKIRLVLQASHRKQGSDSLVGILPGNGSTDEVMILNTHTDGMNSFEENCGAALMRLARYFARRPRHTRNRTLVFSAVTGHFGPGLPETQGFIDAHPDLIKRAAAAVTIEHFGAKEWIDDATGYHPSGQWEIAAIFHSQTPIALPGIDALQACNLRRSELLRPIGDTFFGVGAALHAAGVPSLAYIGGPNYLLAEEHHVRPDRFDPHRMQREIAWTADVLQRLDTIPKNILKAGDSTILGATG
jgi:hypothetical protein